MNRKVAIGSILFFSLVGVFYYLSNNMPLDLNEKEILRASRNAYKNAAFETNPFLKKNKIQELTDFLFRHIHEIKTYNEHKERKTIQLTDGSWMEYSNSGECFNLPTFHEIFLKSYIPSKLIDSLYLYSEGLRTDLISGFSLCCEQYEENIDSTKYSISYELVNSKDMDMNPNYYVYHNVTQNQKFKFSNEVNSIYDYGLSKDTSLFMNLRYKILIVPYSGF